MHDQHQAELNKAAREVIGGLVFLLALVAIAAIF
jgi:hypothetical protein